MANKKSKMANEDQILATYNNNKSGIKSPMLGSAAHNERF